MIAQQLYEHPRIFLIQVPFLNFATTETNCYVIESEGEALVVDTGMRSDRGYDILTRGLSELRLDPERTSFFITHAHMDHVGLLDAVAKPFQPVYFSTRGEHVMKQIQIPEWVDMAANRMLLEGCPEEYRALVRTAHIADGVNEDRHNMHLVGGGDTIPVGGLRLQVVATPGHTPGHLSLFEPESRLLFGGDHILFDVSPGFEFLPGYDDVLPTYFESLDRVKRLHASKLLHAHGPLVDGLEARIDQLHHHHLKRATAALFAIDREPGMTGEEVTRSLTWNVPHEKWEDINIQQRRYISCQGIIILDYLRGLGKVERRLGANHVYRYYLPANS